jgi:glutamyl-tRNA synthetase
LTEALLDLGMSQAGISFSVDWLYAKNRELIDKVSHRYFYVENPVKVIIANVPDTSVRAEPLLLPSDPQKGTRIITSSVESGILEVYLALQDASNVKTDEIVRLKDLMNITVSKINLDIKEIHATFHSYELNRNFSILHWVPEENKVEVSILQPNGEVSEGFGESNLADIKMEKTIQFERYGFVNPIRFKQQELFCYFTH